MFASHGEPDGTPTRLTEVMTGLRFASVVMCAFVVVLISSCGAAPSRSTSASNGTAAGETEVQGDAAVWVLGPESSVDSSSSTFTAFVSRLACNGGVTGRVQAPEVRMSESEVVVTFTVAPKKPGGAACQGNKEVAYEVDIGEPLGDRQIVDGQCLPGGEAVTTSSCTPDSIRYKP